jgi:acetyl-CoA hydrolase
MTEPVPARPPLDLTRYLRPGDRVVWGQGCAEPQTLTATLVAQRHRLGQVTCFVGLPAADVIGPEHSDALAFESYCGTGGNQRLPGLAVVPVPYAALPGLLAGGRLAADVVFVQVSAPDERGRHSLGLADDYFSAALDTARVVIAEVNDQVPYTYGARTLTAADWTACVHSSRPPAELPGAPASPVVSAVAERVAGLVEDGATVQFGVGGLPGACLDALDGHRDLGLHSGLLNDAAMRLRARGGPVRAGQRRGAAWPLRGVGGRGERLPARGGPLPRRRAHRGAHVHRRRGQPHRGPPQWAGQHGPQRRRGHRHRVRAGGPAGRAGYRSV